jgi:hypothetical protein
MKATKMISAKMRCTGGRITRTFGQWLAECEKYDAWHELPARERQATVPNVIHFLNDYSDWRMA